MSAWCRLGRPGLTGVVDCQCMHVRLDDDANINEGDAREICERKLSLEPGDMVSDIVQDPPGDIIEWGSLQAKNESVRTTRHM